MLSFVRPGARLRVSAVLCGLAAGASVLSSCATAAVNEVYTSPDGTERRSSFVAGENIFCVAKVQTARNDVALEVFLQPLEVAGNRLALPGQLIARRIQPGAATVSVPLFPADIVQVQKRPNARIVTAPFANTPETGVALAQDIHDTFVAHMADAEAHRGGALDPRGQLIPPQCQKLDANPDTTHCTVMGNAILNLFAEHVRDLTFHEEIVREENPTASVATAPGNDTPVQQVLVTTYPLLNDLKERISAHALGVTSPPIATPGRYRCRAKFDDDVQTTDFVIREAPAPDPGLPKAGTCTITTVAYCPDPGEGLVRCCTLGKACGKGPAGSTLCYPN